MNLILIQSCALAKQQNIPIFRDILTARNFRYFKQNVAMQGSGLFSKNQLPSACLSNIVKVYPKTASVFPNSNRTQLFFYKTPLAPNIRTFAKKIPQIGDCPGRGRIRSLQYFFNIIIFPWPAIKPTCLQTKFNIHVSTDGAIVVDFKHIYSKISF